MSFVSDPAVMDVVNRMYVEIENATKQVIGRTLVKMDGARIMCRLRECNMGKWAGKMSGGSEGFGIKIWVIVSRNCVGKKEIIE
jgi:hypothetical protein